MELVVVGQPVEATRPTSKDAWQRERIAAKIEIIFVSWKGEPRS
jgi:hypothetical protein